MEKQEFNLSEKIINNNFNDSGDFLDIEDVKEFIKLLKEEIYNFPSINYHQPDEDDIIKIIDKLSGEKLI